jgi:hypothetical protein
MTTDRHLTQESPMTETITPTTTRVDLLPAGDYRRDQYGVLLVSHTEHDVKGRGVHNPHHPHQIEVWENRPGKFRGADPDVLVSPVDNQPTDEQYTVLLSPRAVVISAHPGEQTPQGATLYLGDVVELAIHGYVIGTYRIDARPHHNPHLTRVA